MGQIANPAIGFKRRTTKILIAAAESTFRRLIGLGDCDADGIAGDDYFTPSDQLIVGEDPGMLVNMGVELDDRAPAHLEQLIDWHRGFANHDGQFHIDALDRAFDFLIHGANCRPALVTVP